MLESIFRVNLINPANSGLSACRYSTYCLNLDRYREIAHFNIGMNQQVEYKPFYLTCCSETLRSCSVFDAKLRVEINPLSGFSIYALRSICAHSALDMSLRDKRFFSAISFANGKHIECAEGVYIELPEKAIYQIAPRAIYRQRQGINDE